MIKTGTIFTMRHLFFWDRWFYFDYLIAKDIAAQRKPFGKNLVEEQKIFRFRHFSFDCDCSI
jgi:hypothetical protein